MLKLKKETLRPDIIPTDLQGDVFEIMNGFTVFRNSDGHRSVILNYRAMTEKSLDLEVANYEFERQGLQPARNLTEYWERIAAGLGGLESPLFLEEYENNFEAAAQALKAFKAFRRHTHTKEYVADLPGARVVVGYDPGWYHPCVVIGQIESEYCGRMRVHFHDVVRGLEVPADTFIKGVKEYLALQYPMSDVSWYRVQEAKTPNAGGVTGDNSAVSPNDILLNNNIIAQAPPWAKPKDRVEFINELLTWSHLDFPILNFNPANEDLMTCMDGGYRREWMVRHGGLVPTESYVKDGVNDHVADALGPILLCLFLGTNQNTTTRDVCYSVGQAARYK